MKVGGIRIRKCSVAKLLRDVDAGRFAIPHLQREFVWDGPKAAKLLDSILRAMPIGVILIWDTPRSQRLHLRQKYHVLPAFNNTNRRVWFLIDGQQRVSVQLSRGVKWCWLRLRTKDAATSHPGR